MIARSYKTPKGTELPLLNLKGRQYLEVKYRLVWFREDHPDWSIETELMSVTDVSAYARAIVRDEHGRIIATSHKFESIQGFPDFIEKAETGAIGRALALIGYGTQFCADELDEGSRIVDAPIDMRSSRPPRPEFQRPAPKVALVGPAATEAGSQVREVPTKALETSAAPDSGEEDDSEQDDTSSVGGDPGDYTISFGRKYKGRKLKEIPKAEIEGYIRWLETSAVRPGTPLSHQVEYLKNAFDRMYNAEPVVSHH